MTPFRIFAALIALALAGAAAAQTGERGSIPPGHSQDGSAPSDGALKGGTILPGERGGVPEGKAQSRCNELTGTLREECLKQERSGATGPSSDQPAGAPTPPSPPVTTPPQNPR
jgi:hypothetical protein